MVKTSEVPIVSIEKLYVCSVQTLGIQPNDVTVYSHSGLKSLRSSYMITEFIKEDSPFSLSRAITRTMIVLCYNPLSL